MTTKLRIINIFAGFQNCYGDKPWRVMRGHDYLGSFRTREAARDFIKNHS